MHVLFDGYWWVDGPISNALVEREFILTWLRDYPDDAVTILVPARHHDAIAEQLGPRVKVIGTRARRHATAAALYLPRVARRVGADVMIAHNFTPITGTAVTFIHDVLFQTSPSWFTPAERFYLAPIPLLARRAAALTTSSHHEAQRIRSQNPRLPRVTAVGLAVDPALIANIPRRPSGLPVTDDFVLTVGRLNVRKNLNRTIEAALHSDVISPKRPLVVVGEANGRGAQLSERAGKARLDGTVVFLTHVTSSELAWLYQHTCLFVCLSLDEGWGFTPHEAEYFQARCLVSDIPIFRESLSSQDTVFVDPRDTVAIAKSIARAMSEPASPRLGDPPQGVADWSTCVRKLREATVAAIALSAQ